MTIVEKINQLLSRFEALDEKYTTINSNLDDIWAEGKKKGKADERNAFWEVLQDGGNAQSYYYMFAYAGFTDENYNPIYPIKCSSGTTTSRYIFYNNPNITDTKVAVEFGSNNAQGAFEMATNLHTIRGIKSYASTTFSSTFSYASKLKNILSWSGEIGQTISFADCPLSKASIEVVFGALSDSATSKKVTFKTSAVTSAFGSTESQEWRDLVATKLNWTISLA